MNVTALLKRNGGGSVKVQRASLVESPVGGSTLDWDNPVTEATVIGLRQPAGTSALERAGLLGSVGLWSWYLGACQLAPETNRLQADGITYRVRDVRDWGSHVEALAEVVSG